METGPGSGRTVHTCNHSATGVEIAIWRVREDGGEGQAAGVPVDMGRDEAHGMARALSGARLAEMSQERVGEGLVMWRREEALEWTEPGRGASSR